MPYNKTAYDTTVGKIVDLRKVKLDHLLREALIDSGLSSRTLGLEPNQNAQAVFVIGGDAAEMQIPPFIHPYLIQNYKNRNYLATDVRLFRNTTDRWQTDKEFEDSIRNKAEYTLTKNRAALTLLWLGDNPSQLRKRFLFAGTVFAAWLSQAITRAYALDYQDQSKLLALGIYYYHCLFTPNTRLEGEAQEAAVVHTIKATKFPAKTVYELFEGLGEFSTIEDFCAEARKVVENVRMRDFNLAMLLTLIRNSWYGTNAKEILSIALEHPPTWISVVYAAITERGYKNSMLAEVAKHYSKQGAAEEFQMNYQVMLSEQIAVLEAAASDDLIIKPFED